MKVTLVLVALLGFGTASAVAQNAPSDPSGTQTISEKDLSPRRGRNPKEQATYNSSLERFLSAHRQRFDIYQNSESKTSARSEPIWSDTHWSTRTDPWPVYTKSYFAGIFFISISGPVRC
jgi:hypothetical protein